MSALLPQFIQPEHALPMQLSVLLGITIAVDVLVLSAYAYFAQLGFQSIRSSKIAVWLERAFGATLIFFGIKLLNAARK
jgi:homoserine/homoserine lactone efflux protein